MIKDSKKRIPFLQWIQAAFLLSLTSCYQASFSKDISYDANTNVYTLDSSGGHSEAYYLKALEIIDNEASVAVKNQCLSACAEYLLPAASNIIFINEPIIGMHGNPAIYGIIKYSNFPNAEGNCLTNSSDKILDLQNKSQIPFSYNTYQIEKLEVLKTEKEEIIQGCQTKSILFKNYMWLPTSKHLNEVMNLNFKGSVCADNFTKCSKRIDRRWKAGTRIVMGDEVYISKGR